MLKCIKLDSIPEGLDIEYAEVNTEVGIHFLVSSNFNGVAENIEFGNVWVIVDIPDDFKDETDIFKLVKASSRTLAYVFTGDSSRTEDKVVLDTTVRLKAPITVTFKMSELPTDFLGNLHKFKDKDYMCKVMSDDYIGFERTPDSIEPGVYYVCLVLLQDCQGKLDYDYFVKSLQHEKLAAYYLEKPTGQELTFRYKNKHYDN